MQTSPQSVVGEMTAMNGRRRYRWMAGALVLLTCVFAWPLWQWAGLALRTSLHSHVILIPFVSGYLIWQRREKLPAATGGGWIGAGIFAVLALVLAWFGWRAGEGMLEQDRLALFAGAYLAAALAAGFAILGNGVMRAITFPAAFLVFMVPMPSGLENLFEHGLQRLSADAAQLLFALSGQTYVREGQLFMLPGLNLVVAQECSGIRSSYVLFMLSLVAVNQLLESPWRRTLFLLSILPLSVLRNGFRVFVLAMLTVHVDPGIIDSPLHHRGGPIFFLLSLIPFFGFLWFLKRGEMKRHKTN